MRKDSIINEVDDDYKEFDNIDQIAEDETNISFKHLETFRIKKPKKWF